MSGPLKIRVGLEEVEPEQLGFQRYEIRTINAGGTVYRTYPAFHEYILYRHDEPLIIMERTWTWEENPVIPLADFPDAITHTHDYPTKPFWTALRMLKKQMEEFMGLLAVAPRKGFIPDGAYAYIGDLVGLLLFSLRRRGIELEPPPCWLCGPRIKSLWERIEAAIAEAEQPAPSLGNYSYVDIAREAFELLRPAAGLYRAVARMLGRL